MDFNKIKTLIEINTNTSRWNRGIVYYNRKLVDHVNFNIDGDYITFQGIVESEYNNEVYQNSITIDANNYKILGGRCSCEDYRTRSTDNSLFICKHIVATSIYGLQLAKRDTAKDLIDKLNQHISIAPKPPLSSNKKLLEYFKKSKKEKVNLEINLNIKYDKTLVDFKIGTDKMYVLKNIKSFAESRLYNSPLEYGKNFTYNPNIHYFSEDYEDLIDFIEDYGVSISQYSKSYYNPKFMEINNSWLKRFLEKLKGKQFTMHISNELYHPKVISGSLPIVYDLKKHKDKIILKSEYDIPSPLTYKGDVVLHNNNIYLLSQEHSMNYKKIHSFLKDGKEVYFDKDDIKNILGSLVPKLKEFSTDVKIDTEIENNIVSDFKSEFYFDLKGSKIICELKFVYDDQDGKKYILPDTIREKEIENKLTSYKFAKDSKSYTFNGNDSDLFNFLNTELSTLKDFGDIYYSDKFKSKKIYTSSSINASIGKGIDDYLDFSFNISDIDKKEYKNILSAFKEKKNFYKLKDGSFIDLQEYKTKSFFELVENLDLINNLNNNKIHNNKVLYINEMIKEKDLDFIQGKELVKDICDKFKNINKIDVNIPDNLTNILRDYQVNGLHWFNTLNHYNFGGILADEMGLGKTLQTIAFLLSQKDKKSIIITPTSLIYNWKNEFDTFAPSMKVLLIHGNKPEREKSFENMKDYDVIITTYGTLRNDLEKYQDKIFDYCIIDEAQNIKNPVALSTSAVKSVNARGKFALTGTPIENNLLELWSIFDFVMPGYLYNRNKFQDLFTNKEDNLANLKRLIKPFILRRSKKEVMTELPEKIEKKFFVELNKDQRKIYSAYVDDIQQKMEDKDFKNDKITILSYLTRLRQLCLDPSVIVENYNKKSSKIEACLEILEESINNNHKILLFSQFTSVLKNIGDTLNKNNISYSYIDGSTKAKDRLQLVNDFNESDENKVFLISLKAGGTGLNLTSADVVIHFDPWWNPSVENQASDRAHRYGQKNVVEVIKLIAKGTIEEKIVKLQESKKELIDEFINGDLSNGNILKSLSDKEIIDLFS